MPAVRSGASPRGLILTAAALWGTVGVASEGIRALLPTSPLTIGFLRLALAAPPLAVASWHVLGRRVLTLDGRDVGLMVLMGLLLALYQVCFFGAIPLLGVGPSTLVCLGLAPVVVAWLGSALLRERPAPIHAVTTGTAVAGLALLVAGHRGPPAARLAVAGGLPVAVGLGLALAGAVGYALFTVVSRAVAGRVHPMLSAAIAMAVGSGALLPAVLATGPALAYPARGWALLLYLALGPTALAYGLYLRGARETPAALVSLATLMEPLTATGLAWAVLGERLGWRGGIGAALILLALAALPASGRVVTREADRCDCGAGCQPPARLRSRDGRPG